LAIGRGPYHARTDDDQRRAPGGLPLGVEHLPGAPQVSPGRGIERDHAAVARIERDGDLVVAAAAPALERQDEAEDHRPAGRELAPEVGVRAADRVRLEAARPGEVAQRAELDAAVRHADLARQLVHGPPPAPRPRDHGERGEAAVVRRLLVHDGRGRGAEPSGAELARPDRARAADVRQAHAAAGDHDRRGDREPARRARCGRHGRAR
jgi:hypothetical protein